MVITKRYNSVERFTSMELSSSGNGVGGGGDGMAPRSSQQMLAIIPAHQPSTTWINQQQPSQAQQQSHPALIRRPSNEQLLQHAPSSPAASTPHSLPITMIAAPSSGMPRGTPSPYLQQQQQPPSRQSYQSNSQYPPQQQQQRPPYPQPRSIMRPSQSQQGHYEGMPPTAQQYAIGGGQQQYPPQKAYPPQMRASTPGSRQSHIPPPQHLADVYSQSHDDAELAGNMRSFFAQKVPSPIWLTISTAQIIAGIVSLFIGALNASPYNCRIEPNIPIYLIISGILLIVNGSIRIFFYLTSSSNSNKRRRMVRNPSIGGGQRKSQAKGTNYRHLCEYALDGTILFGIMIIVILGCIWVYGASRYMHSQRYMYENTNCHTTVYWTAWWSVTLHLGFFAFLILGFLILLVYGALIG